MPLQLNKPAYRQLVGEDIEWLLKQQRTLKRDHIEMCLRWLLNHDSIRELDGARTKYHEIEITCPCCRERLALTVPRSCVHIAVRLLGRKEKWSLPDPPPPPPKK